ncbi:hypothetical protein EV127DRAFT_218723 [Xylaria flabelliformis]|nr:hypothetical protein EV127DRAFT_218723 [Xylaria flabelliformis]
MAPMTVDKRKVYTSPFYPRNITFYATPGFFFMPEWTQARQANLALKTPSQRPYTTGSIVISAIFVSHHVSLHCSALFGIDVRTRFKACRLPRTQQHEDEAGRFPIRGLKPWFFSAYAWISVRFFHVPRKLATHKYYGIDLLKQHSTPSTSPVSSALRPPAVFNRGVFRILIPDSSSTMDMTQYFVQHFICSFCRTPWMEPGFYGRGYFLENEPGQTGFRVDVK